LFDSNLLRQTNSGFDREKDQFDEKKGFQPNSLKAILSLMGREGIEPSTY
jgi:hypothetical protein